MEQDLPVKLTLLPIIKKNPRGFIEPEGSSALSQTLTNCPYPWSDQSRP
jgi:hypothetical protein